MSEADVTLFHATNTRSSGMVYLLEELGVPYRIHRLSFAKGEHKAPAYLAINPMGKVPAIRHGDTVVTEQGAIALYLGDLFPERGLAPQMGDRDRGELLRWLFFYGSCFEPALCDRALKREPGKPSMMPYGTFEDMIATLTGQLAKGPWLLGEHFTVADALWGSALTWTTAFGLLPAIPEVSAYVARIAERPALARAKAIDAEAAAAGV
ncbi:glutathione S-transferase family protein [Siculibacillus lacustris]|uniref:Glutathione S-transferase family protein n=1 Tax=Siculibacillus lacustris TaxID=1549641 RepID=A0A4Q9VIE2_9HYPH|nr:glutathione S-transferase family protein [Siculibacillus lacustris]TBW34746.1 glutathione S-transferase family protein [Siculibacillus lacustris]